MTLQRDPPPSLQPAPSLLLLSQRLDTGDGGEQADDASQNSVTPLEAPSHPPKPGWELPRKPVARRSWGTNLNPGVQKSAQVTGKLCRAPCFHAAGKGLPVCRGRGEAVPLGVGAARLLGCF